MNKKGGLFAGVIVGIMMLIGGTILLWWNEGNNVRNLKATAELEQKYTDVSSETVDPANDGKLVAMGGDLTVVDERVGDAVFSVAAKTALLKRTVEMYQWEEHEEGDGDSTTYSYEMVWKEELIDSTPFHNRGHENPTSMPYDSAVFGARDVLLGAYRLSAEQIENLPAEKAIDDPTANMPNYTPSGRYLASGDLSSPKIGDIRISWSYNDWSEATVLAQISGESFVTYTAENGKTYNRVEEGLHTGAEMIQMIRDDDNMLKWILRAVGAVAILIGYLSLISPLTKVLSFIPIFGGLVSGALFLVELLASIVHSLVVIAIAWVVYRPVIGISLLAAALVLIILQIVISKKKKANA